jgi:hypothetical protein
MYKIMFQILNYCENKKGNVWWVRLKQMYFLHLYRDYYTVQVQNLHYSLFLFLQVISLKIEEKRHLCMSFSSKSSV